jgi:phosphohistidine phosphatase SixA
MPKDDRRQGHAATTLHLLRHAHAGDPLEWEGPDELRPLTRRGRRQAERLGAFLEAHGQRPDVIVSSPKVRSVQTAEIVAAAMGMTVRVDERLAGGFDEDGLAALLTELGARKPMLVGHDPDLSELLGSLVGTGDLGLRKGSLATVALDGEPAPGSAALRWLVPPELLERD